MIHALKRTLLLSTVIFVVGLRELQSATINGGEGDDKIIGTERADTIQARAGDDNVTAKGGDDWISAGPGNDIVDAGPGNDFIVPGVLSGLSNAYDMRGWTNTEVVVLKCGEGDDAVALNHSLPFGSSIDGGAGVDSIWIGNGTGGVSVDYKKIVGFENWIFDGSRGGDQLILGHPTNSSNSVRLVGLQINPQSIQIIEDNITGLTVRANGTVLSLYANTGPSVVDASEVTSHGIEFIIGQGGEVWHWSNVLGSQAADIYSGFVIVDRFKGNSGDDYFDGQDGIDTAIYSGNKADYTISEVTYNTFTVKDNRPNSPDGTDTIVDVNKLQFADQTIDVVIRGMYIVGDDSNEEFTGGPQSDFLDGAGGDDGIAGGSGNDTEVGGTGSDTMMGGLGNDFVYGDEKVDAASATKALSADTSTDVDTINYARAKAAITVNLKTGKANSTAAGDLAKIGIDTLRGIENIKASSFDDTLRGSSANNFIDGGNGRDVAIMTGRKRQYTVTYDSKAKTYTVVDKTAGRDGTDTLKNVEVIRFTDGDQVTMSASSPAVN